MGPRFLLRRRFLRPLGALGDDLQGEGQSGNICARALKRRVEQVTGLPFAFELDVA
jgi:hypothetical protein